MLTPNTIMWGQDSHTLEDIEVEDVEITKFHRRLCKARQHAWSLWQKEYIHGLMESHRINRVNTPPPEVGEIVLIVGEEKNRGKWMKVRVVKIVKGSDGISRGVILLHKGHHLERPIQSICQLEIKCEKREADQVPSNPEKNPKLTREKRKAAIKAQEQIKELYQNDEIYNFPTNNIR